MSDLPEMITIFRSADPGAEDDANTVCDMLVEAGFTAVLVDDSEPGVFEGSWEVRVPAGQAEAAEAAWAEAAAAMPAGDPSEDLDLVALFEEGTELSELEATSLQSLLEANGITAMVVGASGLPSIPYEVRVPREQLEAAEQVVADAVAAGSEGAETAEAEGQ
jgi:ribosomal protein L11 methylase PrmA